MAERASGRIRHRRASAICLFVLLFVAVACIPNYTGNTAGPKVGVLGNSVVNLSSGSIHWWLDDTHSVSVLGQNNYTINDSLASVDEFVASKPAIMVIELGTNDALKGNAHVVQDMKSLVYRLRSVPGLILLTNNTVTYNPGYNAISEELNAFIRQGPWLVVDWDAYVKEYTTNGSPWGPLTTDTIHPTGLGQFFLGALIHDQVEAFDLSASPIGWVDRLWVSGSSVHVAGWALDPSVTAPIDVQMYIDWEAGMTVRADMSRPDVGVVFPAYGVHHGYDVTLEGLARGVHTICVRALNAAGTPGESRILGCTSVNV